MVQTKLIKVMNSFFYPNKGILHHISDHILANQKQHVHTITETLKILDVLY